MPNPSIAIPNLLYRYAEAFDQGDFAAAAALFGHGALIAGGQRVAGTEAITAMWRQWVRLYDGRPLTRHVTTNPIITLADDGLTASCRSTWTLLQAAPGLPLQVIASGTYHDRFAVIDGAWHFTERAYGPIDLMGDTRAHLLQTPENEEQ